MSHLAGVFGFIGQMYAIRCAVAWDRTKQGWEKTAWWALMNAWALSARGHPLTKLKADPCCSPRDNADCSPRDNAD